MAFTYLFVMSMVDNTINQSSGNNECERYYVLASERELASAKIKTIFSWLSSESEFRQFLVAAVIIFVKRRYYMKLIKPLNFEPTFGAFFFLLGARLINLILFS